MALMMLAGCGASDSSSGNSETASHSESKGDESTVENAGAYGNVKVVGRTYESDGVLWLGYSGTGVDFDFTGDTLKINMIGSYSGMDNKPRAALYVDGERKDDQLIASDGTTFEVKGSPDKAVNVKLVKLSECGNSSIGILNIDAGGGTVTPAAAKSHKIEIIGDSITCGYGVDDEDPNHHFATSTEDCTKSYSYKTAQLLDADYSLVAMSGWGIISGYSGDGKKVEVQQLPKYYDKIGYNYNKGFGSVKAETLDWDFNKFVPDVIVINLGTNDASYTGTKKDRQQDYQDSYVAFLKQIREKNPTAKIYCTLGIMDARLNKVMAAAAEAYTAETGDSNIATFEFPLQDSANDGIVADYHPSDTTHTKSAQLLADFIKQDMGW
ncbi:MAG: GDSL family lipase [Ruminococcus sp.]|nr:GDSL family lipase [Ruminococcus sp.]